MDCQHHWQQIGIITIIVLFSLFKNHRLIMKETLYKFSGFIHDSKTKNLNDAVYFAYVHKDKLLRIY